MKGFGILNPRDGCDSLIYNHDVLNNHIIALCVDLVKREINTILELTKTSQCTDSRDRIYAILSLIGDNRIQIQPDYTKSPEMIFTDAVKHVFEKTNSLNLLSSCELNPKRLDIPSWVPDFSTYTTARSLSRVTFAPVASSLSNPPLVDRSLKVQGLSIASIQTLCPTEITMNMSHSSLAIRINRMWTESGIGGTYRCGGQALEAFTRVMKCDGFSEKLYPPNTSLLSMTAINALCTDVSNAHDPDFKISYDFGRYLTNSQLTLEGRSLFVSAEGYIGLCTSFAEPGDRVMLVVGCRYPLVMRPRPNGTYSLVGVAFCYGIMHGEPFLGQLPPGVSCVRSSSTFFPLFLNLETGETQVEDPRLGELPAGWSRVEHARADEYSIFLEEKSGKEHYSDEFDPRTTPEELEKRGVKLEDFEIV